MMMLRAIVLAALLALSGCAQKVVRLDSVLPAQIGPFTEAGTHVYPGHAEGYSVRYVSERNHHADVYVFPVPEDLESESDEAILEAMVDATVAGMQMAVAGGAYRELKVSPSTDMTINNERVLKFDGSFERDDLPWYSVSYITESEGTVLKIRMSMPDSESNRNSVDWDAFAAATIRHFLAHPEAR